MRGESGLEDGGARVEKEERGGGPPGVAKGDDLTGLLVMMVKAGEKFRGLEWGTKLQKMVVCMNV